MENEKENLPVGQGEAEEALLRRERELEAREIRLMAGEELSKRGLSSEIGQLLDYSDREKCLESLERASRLIREEAARLMDQRTAGAALPGAGARLDADALSDREYYALTLGRGRR